MPDPALLCFACLVCSHRHRHPVPCPSLSIRFFTAHSDDVTCIAAHPDLPLVASGT